MSRRVQRLLGGLLALYLLLVAVDVTAAHPEITPLSPRWATQISRRALDDLRGVLLRLAALRDALMAQEPIGETKVTLILPPLTGLEREVAAELLRRLEITNVEFLVIPAEQCRHPGVVVTTLPAGGTRLRAEDPVTVFVCESGPALAPKPENDARSPSQRSREALGED